MKKNNEAVSLEELQFWAEKWGFYVDENDQALLRAAAQEGRELREGDKRLHDEIVERYKNAQVERSNILNKLNEQESLERELESVKASILEMQRRIENDEAQDLAILDYNHDWKDALAKIRTLEVDRKRLIEEHDHWTATPLKKQALKKKITDLDNEILYAQNNLIERQEVDLGPYRFSEALMAHARHGLAESKVKQQDIEHRLEEMRRHSLIAKKEAVEKRIQDLEMWLQGHAMY